MLPASFEKLLAAWWMDNRCWIEMYQVFNSFSQDPQNMDGYSWKILLISNRELSNDQSRLYFKRLGPIDSTSFSGDFGSVSVHSIVQSGHLPIADILDVFGQSGGHVAQDIIQLLWWGYKHLQHWKILPAVSLSFVVIFCKMKESKEWSSLVQCFLCSTKRLFARFLKLFITAFCVSKQSYREHVSMDIAVRGKCWTHTCCI